MNIGYENIPVPAWQNETLLPGTVHPEEKNLRPNEEVVLNMGEYSPILENVDTYNALGINGKLATLVGLGENAAIAVVDIRGAQEIVKNHPWEEKIHGTKRIVGEKADGSEIIMYEDYVAVIESSNRQEAEIVALEPGVLLKVGREELHGRNLPDTVSRHHCDVGVGEDGKLYVRNQNPTNATKIVHGSVVRHKTELHERSAAADAASGEIIPVYGVEVADQTWNKINNEIAQEKAQDSNEPTKGTPRKSRKAKPALRQRHL